MVVGSQARKKHDMTAEGAKNLRKGRKPRRLERETGMRRPTQASDEAEQKARTAREHESKGCVRAGSERKTPRTGVASKVEGDGPTR